MSQSGGVTLVPSMDRQTLSVSDLGGGGESASKVSTAQASPLPALHSKLLTASPAGANAVIESIAERGTAETVRWLREQFHNDALTDEQLARIVETFRRLRDPAILDALVDTLRNEETAELLAAASQAMLNISQGDPDMMRTVRSSLITLHDRSAQTADSSAGRLPVPVNDLIIGVLRSATGSIGEQKAERFVSAYLNEIRTVQFANEPPDIPLAALIAEVELLHRTLFPWYGSETVR
jgi:hypothetical protein